MILGIGTINLDYIINCRKLPKPKESIFSENVTKMLGGKGANQIVAAGRLGAETMFISMVGENDSNNEILFNDLKWAGVNTDYIGKAPAMSSGSAYVMVEDSGQNAIIINVAANAAITRDVIDKNIHCFEAADVVMTEFSVPMETCEYAMKTAKEMGCSTIVNPAPYAEISDDFYRNIDIITPNEMEAAGFCKFPVTDEKSASKASAFFHEKGVKNVVITMGHLGAFVSDGTRQVMIPSYKVDAVDTSGAGDSFNGGFAYAYSKKKDIFAAAEFANAVASLSVQKRGTAQSMPTLSEVENVLGLQ
ncbi:ribokinase [Anaerostipes sp.]|uniref:ribokinase n=1 Tax=Anaerostipes sp. TaxID=1872530 RepID=UPI0025BEA0F6|nr:ribokinase [Anaerostipes sp.]MBS7008810.1 ribokinase [Anaerostipes sp.]